MNTNINKILTLGISILFSAPVNDALAASPLRISTAGNGGYSPFGFSPDGSRVYYNSDPPPNSPFLRSAIYSVSPIGLDAASLTSQLSSTPNISTSQQISAQGRVFYDVESPASVAGIYSASMNGDSLVRLTNGTEFGGFNLSPDGNRVVYYTYPNGERNYYSVTSLGGPASTLRLNANHLVAITSDSSHVILVGDNGSAVGARLYSIPAAGGRAVTLDVLNAYRPAELTPDGSRIVYYNDVNGDDVYELYSMPAGGGARTMLRPTSGYGSFDFGLIVSPDSSNVVYRTVEGTEGLFSVPVTGGAPTQLYAGPLYGYQSLRDVARFSPEGSFLLYLTGAGEHYIVPTSGGESRKIDGYRPNFSPDGSRIAYLGNLGLSITPTAGGSSITLSGPGGVSGDFHQFSSDGSRIIYFQSGVGLSIVPSAGGARVGIAGSLSAASPQFSPDGRRVIFQATDNGRPELYMRVLKQVWNQVSGNWDVAANWDLGETPDEAMQISIQGAASVTASGNAVQRRVNELHLGGDVVISTLTLESAATIIALNGVFVDANGVLAGNGSIVGDLDNSGIVAPGASPGMLLIDGSYAQSAAGLLGIEFAGPTSFDQLLVTGAAVLDGVLDLSLMDFAPNLGDAFEIVRATGGISGRFTDIQLPSLPGGLRFDVRYDATSVNVAVVGVPEPSALVLAALALVPFRWRVRDRRRRRESLQVALVDSLNQACTRGSVRRFVREVIDQRVGVNENSSAVGDIRQRHALSCGSSSGSLTNCSSNSGSPVHFTMPAVRWAQLAAELMTTRTRSCSARGSGAAGFSTPSSYVASIESSIAGSTSRVGRH